MYIGSFWREKEKATAKVKVLIRRRQRRLEKLELHHEMVFVASTIDLGEFVAPSRLDVGSKSAYVQGYPGRNSATPVA